MNEIITSPLFLDGWLEFNRQRWGLEPRRLDYRIGNGVQPSLKIVCFITRRGQVQQAPNTPYMPLAFQATPTGANFRVYRQWLDVAGQFAADLERWGISRPIALPPEIIDVRPWQWRGFATGSRFTFHIDLPFSTAEADASVRKNVRKAAEAGYVVNRDDDMDAVLSCLVATESRQRFTHGLNRNDLQSLQSLLGTEHFRSYVARTKAGEPVSARIILHVAGARALDWVAGTKSDHLRGGVTQQLIEFALADLHRAGATSFDFAGANRHNIAEAKMVWGGRLVCYHTIESKDARFVVKALRDTVESLFAFRSQGGVNE